MDQLAFIAVYFWTSYAVYIIARRFEQRRLWLCAVPFGREWLLVKSAGRSWKWFLVMLIPAVNIIAGLVVWSTIARRSGRRDWFYGILMQVPFFNLLVLYAIVYPDFSWYDKVTKIAGSVKKIFIKKTNQ